MTGASISSTKGAPFNVGLGTQRNKLIYALADAALVVNSDLNKDGTWAGAREQLDKLNFVNVYVRQAGARSPELEALRSSGAELWPEPRDPTELVAVLARAAAHERPSFHPVSSALPAPRAMNS